MLAMCFVKGHRKPSPCPPDAKYVRRHPDGSPMLAESTEDTIEDCAARWQAAQSKPKRRRKPQKGAGDE